MVDTPNKGYPLQATGSNTGAWGIVLNNQIFGVIDLNLGGRYNIDVSGSSDVTLTADDAQNVYHHLTGILTGNINYIFPAPNGGFFIVYNNTSGAYTVTVKPAGGTGLVVPQGYVYLVFIDPDTGSAVLGSQVAVVSGGGLEYFSGALRRSALTGDVTATAGSNATTLADNTVSTNKIVANAVTLAKLATQSTGTVLANVSGSAAVPAAVAIVTVIAAGGGALLAVENQTQSGGANVTEKDLGTISSGTVTPDPGDCPNQKYVNNGAHTLAPSSGQGNCWVDITNDASAGAITTSGWTKVIGSFDTTNGHKFSCGVHISDIGSLLMINPLQ